MRTAVITGVTGQDGALLAKFLLDKGYKVIGIQRRSSNQDFSLWRLQELKILDNPNLILLYGDLSDIASLQKIFRTYYPDEIYNLAAQSYVAASWQIPLETMNITGSGAVRVFEAAQLCCPDAKVYQASSSEMFGGVEDGTSFVLGENSKLNPKSPYAAAKVLAHNAAHVYRNSYNMFISCGILFNHESEYRGIEFVTRKITDGVARIHLKQADKIELGNLNAYRDWGYAGDYVEAMWKILQHHDARDFVIATGEAYSVSDFCAHAFKAVGIEKWQDYVVSDAKWMRPNEVAVLRGDSQLAQNLLNWKPTVSFDGMVKRMVKADIKRLSNE